MVVVWGVISVKIVCTRYRVYVFEKEGYVLKKSGYVFEKEGYVFEKEGV